MYLKIFEKFCQLNVLEHFIDRSPNDWYCIYGVGMIEQLIVLLLSALIDDYCRIQYPKLINLSGHQEYV